MADPDLRPDMLAAFQALPEPFNYETEFAAQIAQSVDDDATWTEFASLSLVGGH